MATSFVNITITCKRKQGDLLPEEWMEVCHLRA